MEEILTQFLNSGPVGIVSAAVVYLIITLQRNSTGKKRDDDNDKLAAKIAVLENEIEAIKSLDLATKLAQIQTDIQWIKSRLMEKSK
jgi:Tfp pilus assembly protein PilN